jgi:hypothetical protein
MCQLHGEFSPGALPQTHFARANQKSSHRDETQKGQAKKANTFSAYKSEESPGMYG